MTKWAAHVAQETLFHQMVADSAACLSRNNFNHKEEIPRHVAEEVEVTFLATLLLKSSKSSDNWPEEFNKVKVSRLFRSHVESSSHEVERAGINQGQEGFGREARTSWLH